MTDYHGYSTPAKGSADWDGPLNDNFRSIDADIEIRDVEANLGHYSPKDGSKFLATDTGKRYIGDGSSWSELPVASASVHYDDDDAVALGTDDDFHLVYDSSTDEFQLVDATNAIDVVTADRSGGIALGGSLTAGGDIDMGSTHAVTNLPAPTADGDATRKQYVDALEQGLDLKDSVRAATDGPTVDLSSATDPNPIDGVTLSDGDRVLLKDQSTASENGLYEAVTATDPTTWVRTDDADEDAEVTSGLFTFIEAGTANGNDGYVLATNDPISVGADALSFVQFSGAGSLSAGDGLVTSGDTLNIEPADFAGAGLQDDGSDDLALTNDTVTVAGNAVALGGSTAVDHADLSNIGPADHHTRYTDTEARGAVEGVTDVADLVGGLGTSGQVPQTDGTVVSWVSLAAGDISDVSADSVSNAHHTRYSDEEAQDSVGTILGANFTYDDAGNAITLDDNFVLNTGDTISGTLTASGTPAIDLGSSGAIQDAGTDALTFNGSGDVVVGGDLLLTAADEGTVTATGGSSPAVDTVVSTSLSQTDAYDVIVYTDADPAFNADYKYNYDYSHSWDDSTSTLEIDLTVNWDTDPGGGNDVTLRWEVIRR